MTAAHATQAGSLDPLSTLDAAPSPDLMFAPAAVRLDHDQDGCVVLRHALDLGPYDRQVGDWVRRWAAAAPQRIALAEFDGTGALHTLTYAALRDQCDRVAQALLGLGLSVERPIVLLSEKSIPHALLTLAALQCGIPVCPVSPAYALRPEAHGRLRACLRSTTPGLVLVEDGIVFASALALLADDVQVVYERNAPLSGPATVPAEGRSARPTARPFADLLNTLPGAAVEAAFAAVDVDAPAKILFTSGSTGEPKAVINTQRMMCSNAQAQRQLFPFLGSRPPVIVDWQPWHHCGGGNFNFHTALCNGGSYYIDHGKPTTDAAFAPTLHALRHVSPTLHFNVPLGYDRLAFHLRRDAELSRHFFAELDCLFYSGAAMPPSLWAELEQLGIAERGVPVPMVSSYGMTEMAPLHVSVHWHEATRGMIGLPVPGSIVKLVPVDDKLELRAKGPNITPGYHRAPALTQQAFDAQGWYCSGDAVTLVDAAAPQRGLLLEGRLTDQFKLQSGTWVRVGELRPLLVGATAPLLEDVLIAGEGCAEIGVLAIPHLAACRERFGQPLLSLHELIALPELRAQLHALLVAFNAANPASSRRIARALLIDDVPSLAAGETTDKGHINQKLAVQRRAALVARLFDDTDAAVLRP